MGLGSPGYSNVSLICKKAICMSDLELMRFTSMLYEFDAYFYLSTALMMV